MFDRFPSESPENWIPLVHPEGALYWAHETEVSSCTHTSISF